jgi:hypothetical protein
MRQYFITACLLIAFTCHAQHKNSRINRRSKWVAHTWELFNLGVSYGNVNQPDRAFNNYIGTFGFKPVNSLHQADFFLQIQADKYNGGMTIAAINSRGNFGGGYFAIFLGRSIFQNLFFRSNLNGQTGWLGFGLQGLTPTSITNPKTNEYLLYQQGFAGLSSQNYFRLWRSRGSTHGTALTTRNRQSLILGVEYSINIVTRSKWEWGTSNRGYHYSIFNGTPVSDVPPLDTYFSSVKLSLVWKL